MLDLCVRCKRNPIEMISPADLYRPCWKVWWNDDPKNDPYWEEMRLKSKKDEGK